MRASSRGALILFIFCLSWTPALHAQSNPEEDFSNRCNAPGVLLCRGFDSSSELTPSEAGDTGVIGDYRDTGDNSVHRLSIDNSVKASGGGSIRMEIPTNTYANMAGSFRQVFPQTFGENSEFYAQFRYRVTDSLVNTDWSSVTGTSGVKITIFHYTASTCADIEWTTMHSTSGWGMMSSYTDCGARNVVTNNGIPPYNWQQGDFTCPYAESLPIGSNPNCFYLSPNKWITLYYKMTIGNWGVNNSRLEAWMAVDGQPYRKWVDMPNYAIYNTPPAYPGFNAITLLPYMTDKSASAAHDHAQVWYDELIISTQPIAAPGLVGSSSDPGAPQNLRTK